MCGESNLWEAKRHASTPCITWGPPFQTSFHPSLAGSYSIYLHKLSKVSSLNLISTFKWKHIFPLCFRWGEIGWNKIMSERKNFYVSFPLYDFIHLMTIHSFFAGSLWSRLSHQIWGRGARDLETKCLGTFMIRRPEVFMLMNTQNHNHDITSQPVTIHHRHDVLLYNISFLFLHF